MADARLVARALAEAFFAGPFQARSLAKRGERVLGARPEWLIALASRFARRRSADVDAAVERILDSDGFSAAANGVVIRTWLFREPVFGARGARFAVPPMATAGELAAFCGLTTGQLLAFADVAGRGRRAKLDARVHYRSRWIARPAAAPRLIEAPKPLLAAVQRKILREILDHVPAHDAAHGFVRTRSARTFAAMHAGRAGVLRLDLEGFFGSISGARVTAIFEALGYPREVARLLAGLTTTRARAEIVAAAPRPDVAGVIEARFRALRRAEAPHLPQGSPTSPALANLAAFGLDVRLAAAARVAGVAYARYADDIALSGDGDFAHAAHAWIRLVARVAAEEGFALQARKTRLMRRGARQRLVGLVVNATPAVSRRDRDLLEAILHRAATRGVSAEDLAAHADYRAHLRGRIAWVASANAGHAQKLLKWFHAIQWPSDA